MTSTSRSGNVRKAGRHVDATASPGHATTHLTTLHPTSKDTASAPEFAAILGLQNLVGNRSVGAMLSESTKAVGRATDDVEPAVQPGLGNRAFSSLLTGGRPLDPEALDAAERRFGRTFAHVRVHEDGPARDTTDRLGARAFTYGADVFFAAGEYAPGTRAGDRLIYHELTHVVQQEDGGALPPAANRDSPEERAAEHVAAAPEHAVVDTGGGTAPGIALQARASGSETTAQQAARLRIFLRALRRQQEEQERIAQLHAPRPRSAAPSPPQAPARRGPAWPQEHPQTWRERVAVSHLEDARAELDRTRLGTPEHEQARLRDMAALKELEEKRFRSWFHRDIGLPLVEQAALAAATGPIAEASTAVRVGFVGLAGFGLGETIQGETVSLRPSTFGQTTPLTGWNRFAHGLGSASGLAGGLAPELGTIPRPPRGGGRPSARTSTSTAAPAARTPAPAPPAGGATPIVLEGGGGAMTAEGLAVTGRGGRVMIEPTAAEPSPVSQVFQRPAPGVTRPAPQLDMTPGVETRFATDPAAVVRDVQAAGGVPVDPATIAPPTPPGLQTPWRFPASVPLTGAAGFLFPPTPGGVPMLDEPRREPTMRDPVRPGNLELPAAQDHSDAPIGDAPTRERIELASPTAPTGPTASTPGSSANLDKEIDEAFAEYPGTTKPKAPPGIGQGPATPAPTPTSAVSKIVESTGANTRGSGYVAGSAQTARSTITGVGADLGEVRAYKTAVSRGEIGLQSPAGSNVPGLDFLTADRDAQGDMWVFVNDAKTSTTGKFPKAKTSYPATWNAEVKDAVSKGRLGLGDAALEAEIRDAVAKGRIRFRQINVDMSPSGQGKVTGF